MNRELSINTIKNLYGIGDGKFSDYTDEELEEIANYQLLIHLKECEEDGE